MSEAGLWLNYSLGGLIAFVLVRFAERSTSLAMLAGTAIPLAIWLGLSLIQGSSWNDPWLPIGMMINAGFSASFAAAGILIAKMLKAK